MGTAARKLWAAALGLALGCGESTGPISLPTARIDFVDGAVEPVLVRDQPFVVEGFGFGVAPGVLHFAKLGGGRDTAAANAAGWSNLAVRATVPDSAVSGSLTLVTALGHRLTVTVHVLPRVPFDTTTLNWQSRPPLPRAPVGVAIAVAEYAAGANALTTTLYAVGGAEPIGGDSLMAPDSGIYASQVQPGGGITTWARQRDDPDATFNRVLPVRRAFAAAVIATRHNSRFTGSVLYVIGGIDETGRAQATVFGADVGADSVQGPFISIEPLPAPVAGAVALMRRGRIYVIGGTDSVGRPQRTVYVGRVGIDGHIDGWYQQPLTPTPRAYGGGIVLDERAIAFGGVSDSVAPGAELEVGSPTRLVSSDTAPVSLASGFFVGSWGSGATLLPDGRSQFATLDLGSTLLAVGGIYTGAPSNSAETLAATISGDSIGPFTGPVGNTIAGQGGGTLVDAAGASWRDADGTRHGLVAGGMDLITRLRRAGTWGF